MEQSFHFIFTPILFEKLYNIFSFFCIHFMFRAPTLIMCHWPLKFLYKLLSWLGTDEERWREVLIESLQFVFNKVALIITGISSQCIVLQSKNRFMFTVQNHQDVVLIIHEVNCSTNTCPSGYVKCCTLDLSVAKNHTRLDLPSGLTCQVLIIILYIRHVQAKGSTFPNSGISDELDIRSIRAVDIDDRRCLTATGWCVTSENRVSKSHRLVSNDKTIKNVSTPSFLIFVNTSFSRVFGRIKAVEDSNTICETWSADVNYAWVQTKTYCTWKYKNTGKVPGCKHSLATLIKILWLTENQ